MFVLGTTTVTCNASDAVGNAATPTTFSVGVVDTTAPVITLTGAPSLTLTVGDSFTDEGATTADIVDGAGTADVSGSVNTSSAGTYTLTYDKTDAAGNHAAAVTRTVTVNAPPAPPPPPSSPRLRRAHRRALSWEHRQRTSRRALLRTKPHPRRLPLRAR